MLKILKFLKKLDLKFKLYFILLVAFGIPISFLEVIGIATIFPIVSKLTEVTQINFDGNQFISLSNIFGDNTNNLILFLLFVILLKNFLAIFYNFFAHFFSQKIYLKVCDKILNQNLNLKYIEFIQKNNATFLRDLREIPSCASTYINTYLTYLIDLFTTLIILIFLFVFSFKSTFVSAFTIFLIFYILNRYSKKKAEKWGKNRLISSELLTKNIISIFKNFIEIKFFNKKNFFIREYVGHNNTYINENRKIIFLSSITKNLIEIILIFFLIIVSIFLIKNINLQNFIALTAVYVFSFFRILPSINRIIGEKIILNSNLKGFKDAFEIILIKSDKEKMYSNIINNKENQDIEKFNFKYGIELKNISFKYPGSNEVVLKDLSFVIKKNSFFGIKGPSGSGKSTILKILLGIIQPDKGNIVIDSKFNLNEIKLQFLKNVGYVSQNFYILNDTVAKNIALSDNETIDEKKCWEALKLANCDDFVKKLKNGINTVISEDAIDFSGGQRQRISIARALYREPKIIFFDEATSSLDIKTEKNILNDIVKLKKNFTLVLVSHRLETLGFCDEIYDLKV